MTGYDRQQARKRLLGKAENLLDCANGDVRTETATFYTLQAIGYALVAIGHAVDGSAPQAGDDRNIPKEIAQ